MNCSAWFRFAALGVGFLALLSISCRTSVQIGDTVQDRSGDSLESLAAKIDGFHDTRRKNNIARSSVRYFEYCLRQALIEIAESTDESLAQAEQFLSEARRLTEAFENKRDPLANQTGVVQRAFLSPYDGELHPYTIFIPDSYDGQTPMPLIADLMAPGPPATFKAETLGGGKFNYGPVVESLNQAGFIEVWPPAFRRAEAEENFFAVLEEMKRDYVIDEERIFLTGVSGGALSSWLAGLHYPDQIAAIAPITTNTVNKVGKGKGDSPIDKANSVFYFPMNALHVPVLMLHGDADHVSPAETQVYPMVEKMRALGLPLEYVEYPGVGHGLGERYYDGFDRMLEFVSDKRNIRHPKTIDFTTPSMKYSKAYWIWIGRMTDPGEFARVRAEAKDNIIEIKTENISELTVIPDPMVIDKTETVTITIDGKQVFKGVFPPRRPHTGPPSRFIRDESGQWR
jgi:predicted esterase